MLFSQWLPISKKCSRSEKEMQMTVFDVLEILLLSLLGIYSLFTGLFLKKRGREHPFLLTIEVCYGRWAIRTFYILLGLLLALGSVLWILFLSSCSAACARG